MNAITQETATAFLLGRLSEDERESIEESFVIDQIRFDELLQAENDLIDDYVAGRLQPGDRLSFERVFLPRAAQRVNFARALADYAARDEESVPVQQAGLLDALRSWVTFVPGYAYGTAASLVILAAVAFWLTRPANEEFARVSIPQPMLSEIERSTVPSPSASGPEPETNKQTETSPGSLGPLGTAPTTGHKPKGKAVHGASSSPSPGRLLATITLAAGTRSSGQTASASVSNRNGVVRLELPPETGDHRRYSIRVETIEGKQIWQRRIPARPGDISVTVPARRLTRGDYIVTLKGFGANGISETLGEYNFSIK